MQAFCVASLAGVAAMKREIAHSFPEILEAPEVGRSVGTWNGFEVIVHPDVPRDVLGVIAAGELRVVHEVVPAAPESSAPSKAIPWALIALALAILLVSLYASWHTWVGPQLVPVHPHPVDLVGPHR